MSIIKESRFANPEFSPASVVLQRGQAQFETTTSNLIARKPRSEAIQPLSPAGLPDQVFKPSGEFNTQTEAYSFIEKNMTKLTKPSFFMRVQDGNKVKVFGPISFESYNMALQDTNTPRGQAEAQEKVMLKAGQFLGEAYRRGYLNNTPKPFYPNLIFDWSNNPNVLPNTPGTSNL